MSAPFFDDEEEWDEFHELEGFPRPLVKMSKRARRARWLGGLLAANAVFEKSLKGALNKTSGAVAEAFSPKRFEGLSPEAEKAQIVLAQNDIRQDLEKLFQSTQGFVDTGKRRAAGESANASMSEQRHLIERIFPNQNDRNRYRESLLATAIRNQESRETRIRDTKIPLSQQVWKTQALSRGLVDKVINDGLASGKGYRQIAKEVRHLVNPGAPGGISYAALRLGRTEINNAFHAQSIADARNQPWIDHMRWNLGMRHHVPDECDEWEDRLFRADEVPPLPHPNCWCYTTPEMPDWETFSQNLTMGVYDPYINQVMADWDKNVAARAYVFRDFDTGKEYAVEGPEWRVRSPEDYARNKAALERINAVYPELHGGFYGVSIPGQRGTTIDPRSTEELAEAVETMAKKYPDVKLLRLGFGDTGKDYGITFCSDPNGSVTVPTKWGTELPIPNSYYSRIVLNQDMAKEYSGWWEKAKSDEMSRFHTVGAASQPILSTYYHEFGHAMVNALGNKGLPDAKPPDMITGVQVNRAVKDAWKAQKTSVPYKEWIRNNLSGYSFQKRGSHLLDKDEALAEAFDVVERLGKEGATPAEWALHKLLTDRYKARYG